MGRCEPVVMGLGAVASGRRGLSLVADETCAAVFQCRVALPLQLAEQTALDLAVWAAVEAW